jgi:polyphosphate kinase
MPTTDATPDSAADLTNPALYLNRELSWLAFNRRVLEQAGDRSVPLLERIKFVAIFGANLDEFFMIRVSGLHGKLEAEADEPAADGLSTRDQLARIREGVEADLARASALLSGELFPALAGRDVHVASWASLDQEQRKWATHYFAEAVFPLLTPLAVDPVHPFPFLSNLSLSLAVEVRDPLTGERKFARVKVPESLPRFLTIGDGASGKTYLLPLEELIAHGIESLFSGMVIEGCHPFRVTRDMDLDILEDEAADLLSVVDREIRRRRFGAAVRIEVTPKVPEHVRRLLLEKLQLDADDLYETPGPLGLAGLFAITQLHRPDLKDAPLVPRDSPRFAASPNVFDAIGAGDVLLHHPYESFGAVIDFLRAAADDPDVLAIKMTLYRAGSHSETAAALIRAAEKGKQVAVSIELKARFDEENNIGWARALERAGAHVFYGTAGLKTHAKVLLVVRREGGKLRRYVHLSTGNYNASTAKLYTDTGLFTCDPDMGHDASELFNSLSGFSRRSAYRKLAVAPVTLRSTILSKIEAQTKAALSGKPARIFAKLNSLVDEEVIRALYRASMAGVAVDLLVRGVCCLRPGISGISEKIRVHSLVGRFLEHERVVVFGVGKDESFFLTSADWMPRNLDRRVEVLFPIESAAIREKLRRECIEPLERDNCRVYDMDAQGVYKRRSPPPRSAAIDAQTWAAEGHAETSTSHAAAAEPVRAPAIAPDRDSHAASL